MRKYILFLFAAGLAFTSCRKDETPTVDTQLDEDLTNTLSLASGGAGIDFYLMPNSTDFANIPQDENNPITTEKVTLGQLLYHETGLAINPKKELSKGTYSCASCHFASAGFQAGRFQGIGDGGVGFGINGEGRQKGAFYEDSDIDVQPLRTPTAMNGAYQKAMLWNGQFGDTEINIGTEANWTAGTPIATNHLGFEGLETQAIAGLGVHRLEINQDFLDSYPEYVTYLDAAFPNVAVTERYSKKNMGLAIAAYERTLLSNQAPFQKWLRGDMLAMTDLEKQGANLFFGKANCSTCHNGPALNSMEFHALGMKDLFECPEEVFMTNAQDPANLGRGGFTKNEEDNFKFKVPQLYNLVDSPFFGHGASFRSVRDVVVYKNNAVPQKTTIQSSQLAEAFVSLDLTEEEIDALTAFLESGLRDPNLKRFEPESLPSGNCFPFNDPLAANELGCN